MSQDISTDDFAFYQGLLLRRSGLSLTEDKAYLLKSRLTPVADSLGFPSLAAFTQTVRSGMDPVVIKNVVEAMTTNETSFFRDSKPFDHLRAALQEMVTKHPHKRSIRIWSAACSSGQESYSIAMIMQEFLATHPGWSVQIVGTDISDDILAQAKAAEYGQFEVQRGLTIQMMVKHFDQANGKWRVKDDLKRMVQFRNVNLLENFSQLGMFDIVFCRNVLIYFDKTTKADVLSRISKQMTPDGHLFLGACETIVNLNVPLANVPAKQGMFCHAAA